MPGLWERVKSAFDSKDRESRETAEPQKGDRFLDQLVDRMHEERRNGFDSKVDQYVCFLNDRAASEGLPISYEKKMGAANVDIVTGRIPREDLGSNVRSDYTFGHSKVLLDGKVETLSIADSGANRSWERTRASGIDINSPDTWASASHLGNSAVLRGRPDVFANSIQRESYEHPAPELPARLRQALFPHEQGQARVVERQIEPEIQSAKARFLGFDKEGLAVFQNREYPSDAPNRWGQPSIEQDLSGRADIFRMSRSAARVHYGMDFETVGRQSKQMSRQDELEIGGR